MIGTGFPPAWLNAIHEPGLSIHSGLKDVLRHTADVRMWRFAFIRRPLFVIQGY